MERMGQKLKGKEDEHRLRVDILQDLELPKSILWQFAIFLMMEKLSLKTTFTCNLVSIFPLYL